MKVLVVLAFLTLGGCSEINKNIAPKAAQVINTYCLEDQSVRLVVRQQVNELIKPNAVRIDCAGDEK